LDQLEQQVKSLQQQLPTDLAQRPRQNPLAGELFVERSGFALRSGDGNFVIRFHGLIQTDSRFYTGSGANPQSYSAAVDASAQAPAVSGFLLRRVRPILSGRLYQIYDFLIQPDFGQNTVAIYDAYVDVRPWSFANLRIGKFKNPLGLERLQSDSSRAFTERGLTENLIPSRDTGVEFYGSPWNSAITYQASLTNGVADSSHSPDSPTNNAKEMTARVFAKPFKNAGSRWLSGLGIGIAGSYTNLNSALPVYATAEGQEQFLSYNADVAFNGQRSHLVPQANYYMGPLAIYGEYAQTNQVAQVGIVQKRLTNTAWQAAASWVLTGEDASYEGVQPAKAFDPHAGTWGAWEMAARLHQLQVDPNTFPLFADPDVSASRATAGTIGFNWYLDKFVEFTTDYEQTWFKDGNGPGGRRPIERVIGSRAQLAF
jgi:phosphate-selective porin OprO/OprP